MAQARLWAKAPEAHAPFVRTSNCRPHATSHAGHGRHLIRNPSRDPGNPPVTARVPSEVSSEILNPWKSKDQGIVTP